MKTAIMGFGNPTRSDDGVGIYVIDLLRSRLALRNDVSLLDMGTSAFEVLFTLKGHQRIILVDAVVNTGEAVGTLYKVPASEIERTPEDDPMVFLHSIKWDQALSYAKKILQDDYPNDIQVYLIAVDNTRIDISLTGEAKQAAERVAELICAEIDETAPIVAVEV
jgi:hydrogenase maturation protease